MATHSMSCCNLLNTYCKQWLEKLKTVGNTLLPEIQPQ